MCIGRRCRGVILVTIFAALLCNIGYGNDKGGADYQTSLLEPAEIIVYTIKGPARELTTSLFNILKEKGYFISSYYADEGILSASKEIVISTDIFKTENVSDKETYKFILSIPRRMSERRHMKLMLSSKAEQLNGKSKLTIKLRQGYAEWGEFKDVPIGKDSAEFKEIASILLTIKENMEAKYKPND